MNSKLIRKIEVATDAWCDQNLPSDWTDRVDEYLLVWNDKFAELIVRKVFDCIADEGFEVYEPVIQSVKERFGVEDES
jgi:hypothetical protein